VYEVPWGTRTMRLYYRYGVHEMLQLAPTKPLSIGIIRRGKQLNYYVVL
jgi:hypothetical protein